MREDHNVAIWGVNTGYLKKKALEVLSQEFKEALAESKNLIDEGLFEKILIQNNRSLVFPVEPFRMNRRYSLQQSIFISTGIAEIPLMKQLRFLGDDLAKAVVKIEVPSRCKNEALRDLLQMNLHKASLFPDLDGYASSLRLRYESMKTPDELEKQFQEKSEDQDFPFFP
jgi:hypothetical protein